jgi:hypothetical protein
MFGRFLAEAGLRKISGFDQAIRHATHRRHDDYHGAVACRVGADLRSARNAGSVADGSTAEFHNYEPCFHVKSERAQAAKPGT